jgi:hypothetical protein
MRRATEVAPPAAGLSPDERDVLALVRALGLGPAEALRRLAGQGLTPGREGRSRRPWRETPSGWRVVGRAGAADPE